MGFGKMANAKVPKLKYQAKRYEEFLKKKLLNSQKQSVCLEKFNHHRDHFEIVLSQVYGLSAYSLLYFIKINF